MKTETLLRSFRIFAGTTCLILAWTSAAAEESVEVRILRRALAPAVGELTNQPVASLEGQAPGSPRAALALAWRLLAGEAADPTRSRRWIERAAEAGDPVAQHVFGTLAADDERDTEGVLQGDYETARAWWEKAAAQGHALAARDLGDLLWSGNLGGNDASGAERLWKSAATGRPEVERRLGLLYLQWKEGGQPHLDCDPEKAKTWLDRAAQHGDLPSQLALEHLASWTELAKRAGKPVRDYIREQFMEGKKPGFGWVFGPDGPKSGPVPIPSETASAKEWLLQFLEGPDPSENRQPIPIPESPAEVPGADRQFALAELLWNGAEHFAPRPQQAVHWYLAAARQGWAPAMRRLGELWEKGHAGAPDPAEAQRWYRRADAVERAPKP